MPELRADELIPLPRAAELLGIPTGLMRQMRKRGEIAGPVLAGKLLFRRSEVDRIAAAIAVGADMGEVAR